MRLTFLPLAFSLLLLTTASAGAFSQWGSLQPGPHVVGLTSDVKARQDALLSSLLRGR